MDWEDGKKRCFWANPKNERYVSYHDDEWGKPQHDDARLFEMVILECFQAGLSWECILNKRGAFREAFAGFDIDAVCAYDQSDIDRLMVDDGIVRNRKKIEAAVNNARVFREIQREFGSFDAYIWGFTDDETVYEVDEVSSPLSDEVSRDLKKRGMKFVGTVTVYALLQSIGVINSHEKDCYLHAEKQ